jgi:hypothetical protein
MPPPGTSRHFVILLPVAFVPRGHRILFYVFFHRLDAACAQKVLRQFVRHGTSHVAAVRNYKLFCRRAAKRSRYCSSRLLNHFPRLLFQTRYRVICFAACAHSVTDRSAAGRAGTSLAPKYYKQRTFSASEIFHVAAGLSRGPPLRSQVYSAPGLSLPNPILPARSARSATTRRCAALLRVDALLRTSLHENYQNLQNGDTTVAESTCRRNFRRLRKARNLMASGGSWSQIAANFLPSRAVHGFATASH